MRTVPAIYSWFLVRLSDAQVERSETLILTRDVDAWLESGVVNCETLYDFHSGLKLIAKIKKKNESTKKNNKKRIWRDLGDGSRNHFSPK